MNTFDESVHLRKYLIGIIGNAPFGIITLSVDGEIGMINAEAVTLLGFNNTAPSKLIDLNYADAFIHISELADGYHKFIQSNKSAGKDITYIKTEKHVLNIKIRTMFNGWLIIIENITKQYHLEDQLRRQASYDYLTSLSNRQAFESRLEHLIKKSISNKIKSVVVFIDLDRFKIINDTAGHTAGDELLKRIAQILKDKIRGRDLVARIGGDEFAILLENCPLKNAELLVENIRSTINELIFINDDKPYEVGISAGISVIDGKIDKFKEIVIAAENACQLAKNEGRNRIHVCNASKAEYQVRIDQIQWLPKIKSAISNNEFVLYGQKIQPTNSSTSEEHFELLIRLKNADGTITLPDAFIPPAERYDLMPLIDRWVLETAFKLAHPKTSYSINLSGQSLMDDSLADFVEMLRKKHKIKASNITFEITETAAIHNFDVCMKLLRRLKKVGFKFSLDDFGSGLSSFTYLKNMPINYLKIDGSFVKGIANDEVSYAMVKSMNEVGHLMGLKTIAEFVENKQILEKLIEIGVDYAQGYYLHKPEDMLMASPSQRQGDT
ncbi:putative bifunctional diguanylate cyclase/phosphodiesterase [Shewanella subflava]|uniref:EAL domain-containing protein n=1 Tax=Shewanella subflava TaxID=2986476 RepID=A0ABT3I9U2_9GAMM|nr:EAL domain-containing protein [Shewanella subflava]MCW3172628.1 EAL domain-containing protein [Shewanella subflava]